MKPPAKGNKKPFGNKKQFGNKKKGKGGKLDFLDEDDGGHFGLLQHAMSANELKGKKWNKVDLGDIVPEDFGVEDFDIGFTGIEELEATDYPGFKPTSKRKASAIASTDEKAAKKKQKQQKKNAERKEKKKQEKAKQQQQQQHKQKQVQQIVEEDDKIDEEEDDESEMKLVDADESYDIEAESGYIQNKNKNDKSEDEDEDESENEDEDEEVYDELEEPYDSIDEISTDEDADDKKKKKKKNKTKAKTETQTSPATTQAGDQGAGDEEDESVDMSQWKEFGLHPKLISGLRHLRFSVPTEIQKKTLPIALTKKDIIAAAETGSGKTLAFGLPILHYILNEKERNPTESITRQGPLALIISPTRELATQIVDHLKAVAKYTTIKVPIIGGMSLPKQVRLLSYKPDIVVATPGRLWDLHEVGNVYLNHLESARWVVLDEADRLIQGNHFKEMDMLFEKLKIRPTDPETNTTTLIDQNIQIQKSNNRKAKDAPTTSIAKLFSSIRFLNPVETLDITKAQLTASHLREAKIFCEDSEKDFHIYYLLQRYKGKTIAFVNSIHGVKRLTSLLRVLRVAAYPLFSDMEQRMRLKNLDRFRSAERAVLVATDVAARGLDIPNIDHVIHFQVPLNAETYVHRSGRTARANRDGIAVMLISPQDQKNFMKIFTVLKKDPLTVVDFPVDPFFMPAIKMRVQLAHQIELAAHRSKKVSNEKQWLERNLRLAGEDLKEYFEDSDDEDDKSITARKQKKRNEQNVKEMQEELNDKPLLPVGINRNYVTSSHFSTKLLVDPSAFHSSMAISDLDKDDLEDDLSLEEPKGKGKGRGKPSGRGKFGRSRGSFRGRR